MPTAEQRFVSFPNKYGPYADTVKKKYGLDLKANPLGKMLVTGFGPVVNHFMNPIGEELSWYKIQFYTPGKLVIEREK